jgi:hypothetical protein
MSPALTRLPVTWKSWKPIFTVLNTERKVCGPRRGPAVRVHHGNKNGLMNITKSLKDYGIMLERVAMAAKCTLEENNGWKRRELPSAKILPSWLTRSLITLLKILESGRHIRPHTLYPCTFRPCTISPHTLFPDVFTSPHISSMKESQPTELNKPMDWLGI